MTANNWQKFRLLMWKNGLIQWRHKLQTSAEILIPLLCTVTMLILRGMAGVKDVPTDTTYPAVAIDSLDPLRNALNLQHKNIVWQIAYSPENPVLDRLVSAAAKSLGLADPVVPCKNSAHLQFTLINTPYLCGIEFDPAVDYSHSLPQLLRYALRFPGELRTVGEHSLEHNWQTDKSEPNARLRGPRNPKDADGGAPVGYVREGFVAVQHAIADQFLRQQSSTFGVRMPAKMRAHRHPYPPFCEDSLIGRLQIALIVLLSFIYPAVNTVRVIATEKERQLKEAMQIMGMPGWLHWVGWFVRSMLYMLVSVSLQVLMLTVRWSGDAPRVAVLTFTDWTVLWAYLIVYSISTITFCFMMSVFFAKANLAASVTGIAWFSMYLVYQAVQVDRFELWHILLLSAVLANTGMAMGFQPLLSYEAIGEGAQWSNLFRPPTPDNDLSLGLAMCMMLVASVLYLLIALYVEQIRPGEYGVPKPWYFPVMRSFWVQPKAWRIGEEEADDDEADGNRVGDGDLLFERANFERTSYVGRTARHAGIRIRGLRKTFGKTTTAVARLTLDMYEDQITVLLGHNGAGKTTTMSMLTGMLQPSGGTAFVNGYDIRTDIRAVRGSVGLCPQHDILFDDLTVAEHIAFYARLKGVTSARDVEDEIDRYVDLLELRPKRDVAACSLSGGMKRKLSVSVAFCGGSRVVFCDEPSSGMDPAARRALWEVFRKEKHGRTVLLSTHFMDEADVLGDRIAIMNAGRLRCCGSSYFLKKRFGAGYHLVCAKETGAGAVEMEKLVELLQRYDPEVHVEVNGPTEVSLVLTDERVALFETMFGELERRGREVGVRSFGVSLTTLEEVFLKVGTDVAKVSVLPSRMRESMNGAEARRQLAMGSLETLSSFNDSDTQMLITDDSYPLTGIRLYLSHTVALLNKHLIQTRRDWIRCLAQILVPALFVTLTILIDRSQRQPWNLPRLPLNRNLFHDSIAVLQIDANAPADSLRHRYAHEYAAHLSGHINTITTDYERYLLDLSRRDLLLANRDHILGAAMDTKDDDNVTVWFNNQPYHALPVALSLVHDAVLRTHLGAGYGIELTSAPLPYTEAERIERSSMANMLGYRLAMNLAYAMALTMAAVTMPLVREHAARAKLLQFLSGASVPLYWGTAFLYNVVGYALGSGLVLVVFAAFQEQGWSTHAEIGHIAVLLAVFGLAALPVTYVASRAFRTATAAFTVLSTVYIMTGSLFAISVADLRFYGFVEAGDVLESVFMVWPHFALNTCMQRMQNLTLIQATCRTLCDRVPQCDESMMCAMSPKCCTRVFDMASPGIGGPLVWMVVVGAVTIVLHTLLEYRVFKWLLPMVKGLLVTPVPIPQADESAADADVLEERVRVQALSEFQRATFGLVVQDVSKMYGQFCSVNRMSLAVDGGECFGLLGVNGAGKTTTFRMLCGDLPTSAGNVWVRGYSLRTQMPLVQRNIGYCPQFDALIDDMTCRETLHLFARLRGFRPSRIAALCARLANELHLTRHLDKQVRQCSGGNRRKLSTAVAFIGQPAVVYLDEPTTGMDPGAKRHLWDAVNRMRAGGTAMVLTSHSMDECEALCTRLAIMVNGQFKCLGSVQHLKSKFSTGYTLVVQLRRAIRLNETDTREPMEWSKVRVFLMEKFAQSVLQSDLDGLLTFYIPNDGELRWSVMFGRMQRARRSFAAIEDYTISQTTLEQVFLTFAKRQFLENA